MSMRSEYYGAAYSQPLPCAECDGVRAEWFFMGKALCHTHLRAEEDRMTADGYRQCDMCGAMYDEEHNSAVYCSNACAQADA
jgi:hypothetical protein